MSPRESVTHVITTIEIGGAENQLLILSRAQVSLGLEVHVIYLKGAPTLEEKFRESDIEVHHFAANKSLLIQLFALRRYVKYFNGVIHAHLPQAEIVAKFSRPKNFVVTRHFGGPFFPRRPGLLSKILSRIVTSRNTKVIAISQAVRDYLFQSREIRSDKEIHVIYYGFDSETFKLKSNLIPVENEVREFIQDSFVVGIVARLSPEKDFPTFLKAFQILAEEVLEAKALVLGVGPSSVELKNMSKDLGLETRIFWAGKKANISSYMDLMDVLLLTSKFEGFGMVLLEGMSSGLPIIATNVSAIPEVIGNGGPGILVPAGDYKEFASALVKLASSSEKRKELGNLGRNWVKKFSVNKMIKKVNSVYESK